MNLEEYNQEFNLGQIALERGNYRESIKHFERAKNLLSPTTKKAGETTLWLVTAYQANGKSEEAIALCQELVTHPSLDIRKKASDMLYIIKAPRLERPKEWLVEIPDLSNMSEERKEVITTKKKPVKKEKRQIEIVDLTNVNTEDNNFIFVGLMAIFLIVFGLLISNLI